MTRNREPSIDRDLARHIHRLGDEPEMPEAVCQRCDLGWEEGRFYEEWLEGLDPELPVQSQMPEACPECDPTIYEPDQWSELHDEHGPAAHDIIRNR